MVEIFRAVVVARGDFDQRRHAFQWDGVEITTGGQALRVMRDEQEVVTCQCGVQLSAGDFSIAFATKHFPMVIAVIDDHVVVPWIGVPFVCEQCRESAWFVVAPYGVLDALPLPFIPQFGGGDAAVVMVGKSREIEPRQ